jgi:hypothetical protein
VDGNPDLLEVIRALDAVFWTAGRSSPTSTAMIAMTTNSSISVNARPRPGWRRGSMGMTFGPGEKKGRYPV